MGFRWRFRSIAGLEAKLTMLATAEHGCCSFMKFEIMTDNDEIIWEGRAEAHAQTFVDEFMNLPQRRSVPSPCSLHWDCAPAASSLLRCGTSPKRSRPVSSPARSRALVQRCSSRDRRGVVDSNGSARS